MKISKLALAAALAVAWTAVPSLPRAEDEDSDEVVEVEKHVMRGPMGHHGLNPEMRAKFEAVRELEHKTREAAHKLRKGSDAEKTAAKTEAKKFLGELFDAKLAMDERMLSEMEKHAAELKEKIAKKKENREKMIESRLSRLSGEGDDWD